MVAGMETSAECVGEVVLSSHTESAGMETSAAPKGEEPAILGKISGRSDVRKE